MACGQVIHKTGQRWFGRILLWQEDTLDTSLSAVWDEEHREVWFLISDLPAGRRRVHVEGYSATSQKSGCTNLVFTFSQNCDGMEVLVAFLTQKGQGERQGREENDAFLMAEPVHALHRSPLCRPDWLGCVEGCHASSATLLQ
jgi:hypothetical protein